MVPYENIVVIEGFNIRKDMGDLEALSKNILENGQKDPCRGYKEKGTERVFLVDGHRRHAAIGLFVNQMKETYYVPFVFEPQKYNDEQRVIDMFILNDGKNLTPLEQAEGVSRLINFGYSNKEISSKIGRSIAYVGRLQLLLNAPKKLVNILESGRVSASLAMDVLAEGEEATHKFIEQVAAGKYDAHATAELPLEGSKAPKNGRITKSDIKPLNSRVAFKKWAKNAPVAEMDPVKAKFYQWLQRFLNNELDEADFKRYFK